MGQGGRAKTAQLRPESICQGAARTAAAKARREGCKGAPNGHGWMKHPGSLARPAVLSHH